MTPESRHQGSALRDFGRCAREWAKLAAQRELSRPRARLGVRLRFADGVAPVIFRETVRRNAPTDNPAVIVIQFRLALLASNPLLHAAFRRECILHTPLFAGFPGFRSKLWADDVETGVYGGVYGWQSMELATDYAKRMVALLDPFSTGETARYEVIAGLSRDEFLRGESAAHDSPEGWWQLTEPAVR